jgi:exopolysaccharide biosynthesis polyprenyl glycosylphosphotransferase
VTVRFNRRGMEGESGSTSHSRSRLAAPMFRPVEIKDVEIELPRGSYASVTRAHTVRGWLIRRTLLCADILGLLLAYLAAARLASGDHTFDHLGVSIAFVLTLPVWAAGAKLYGLYDRDDQRPDHSTVDDVGRVFQLVTIGSWLMIAGLWLVTTSRPERAALIFWGTAVVSVIATRAIARTVVRRHPDYLQNTIIVGAGAVGQLMGRKLLQHPEFGIRLVGFVDSEPKKMRDDLSQTPVLGSPTDIIEIVRRNGVRRVIIAFSNDRHDFLIDLVRALRNLDVQIDLVPRLFEAVGPIVGVHIVEGVPLVSLPPARPSQLARTTKRAADVAIAATALLLVTPLFGFIAWRIKRDSPGPVFFRQERLGEGQRRFTLFKFRTMSNGADDLPHREFLRGIMTTSALPTGNNLYKLARTDDVTGAGAWLRRTSLDELPQLINVLRGEMSLVGPRPCIPYETELFEPHHYDRFLVPAGMTGLWQVSARAHATFKEALDLDAAYARNWSLQLDLWLLARTPSVLLRGKETM